jgi:hypothetical protein
MMDSSIGWLLDVSIEQNRATIWIKTSEGAILKLLDIYQPSFYVLPKDEYEGATCLGGPSADRGWKIADTRRYYSVHLYGCGS